MSTKISSEDYEMLMWSFDFIRHNRQATTEKIPEDLLKFWSIPDFTTNPTYEAENMQIIVFMYISRLYQHSEGKIENILNSFRFNQLFYNFQIILATVSYAKANNLKLEPFPIFNIKEYITPNLKSPQELIRQYQIITKQEVKK